MTPEERAKALLDRGNRRPEARQGLNIGYSVSHTQFRMAIKRTQLALIERRGD